MNAALFPFGRQTMMVIEQSDKHVIMAFLVAQIGGQIIIQGNFVHQISRKFDRIYKSLVMYVL